MINPNEGFYGSQIINEKIELITKPTLIPHALTITGNSLEKNYNKVKVQCYSLVLYAMNKHEL